MKKWKVSIGILITAVFIVLSAQNINFSEVAVQISRSNPWFVVLASAFYMSSFFFRGLRWQLIIKKKKKARFANSFSYVVIGWMGNNIFPARGGEFLRAFVSGKKEKFGTGFSLGTILVERIFDVFTLITILATLSLFSPFPYWVRQIIIYATGLLIIGSIGIFALIKMNGGPFRRIKFVKEKLDSFISGLKTMNVRASAPVYLLSLVSWLFEVMVFYSIGLATGIEINLFVAAFVLVVVNLGIVIPSSPGYVGTFHFFCMLALGVFMVGKDAAMGFAILAHLSEYIPTTIAGLILLQKHGMSITDAKEKI